MKNFKYSPVGDRIEVKSVDYKKIIDACWGKLRELKKEGFDVNAFLVEKISIYKDGSGLALFQPVKI